MMQGSRPPAGTVQGVDTSAVEARLRAEAADAIATGRWHAGVGNQAEAEWWTQYVAALFGVLSDRWALMTIALGEIDHD